MKSIHLSCLLGLLGLTLTLPLQAKDRLTLDSLFPSDRVIDVQITVEEDDWDTIRYQRRDIRKALSEKRKLGPIERPFTYVPAKVKIDGHEFPTVGIRKKGFLGSLNSTRPSLKVKLDYTIEGINIGGINNLTFNNNNQDTSLVSQFLSYDLFNRAGSPAPRVGYAKVTVNGKNLGIYSHVETVRKPLLKRGFGDDNGTLYEGTVTDFYQGWEHSFERKVGDDEKGKAKIKQLIDALDDGGGTPILKAKAPARAWVPTSGEHDKDWFKPNFDDSKWAEGAGGAGFETQSGYEPHIHPNFDFEEEMHGVRNSLYMRIPFEIDSIPEKLAILKLGVKFDDGFVAYLNGHKVASINAPEDAQWNSRATGNHDDGSAMRYQSIPITKHKGKLRKGKNLLAIHGLNIDEESSDFLIAAKIDYSETSSFQNVSKAVDLEKFFRFWAIESLLGFWDGYTANRNNFFVYHNPKTDKLHFLPWGADSLFEKFSRIDRDPRLPLSVKTGGLLAYKFYQTKSGKVRYRKTLQAIMKEIWDEERLLAECDRIEKLLEPYVEGVRQQRRFPESLDRVREFIRNRREEINEEIADGMPEWNRAPSEPPAIPEGEGNPFARRAPRNNLWAAAREGSVEKIKKHLTEKNIDQLDGMGSSALSWAAGLGRLDAVKFLLLKGANVNQRNRDGNTSLDSAERDFEPGTAAFMDSVFGIELDEAKAAKNKQVIAKLLRSKGAKLGKELGKHVTIFKAAITNDIESLSKIIKTTKNLNAHDQFGSTALSWAAGLGSTEAVELLIKSGADVNARNRDRRTPLDNVQGELEDGFKQFVDGMFQVDIDIDKINSTRPKIAKLLKKHGAKFSKDLTAPSDLWTAARNGDVKGIEKHLDKTDVNAKDDFQTTALMWATGLGRIEAVKLLLKKGADMNLKNGEGKTALDISRDKLDGNARGFLEQFFKIKIDVNKANKAKAEIEKLLKKKGAKSGKEG